jgi:hypothetical protein
MRTAYAMQEYSFDRTVTLMNVLLARGARIINVIKGAPMPGKTYAGSYLVWFEHECAVEKEWRDSVQRDADKLDKEEPQPVVERAEVRRVHLTYYKETGKWYGEGSFRTKLSYDQIMLLVKQYRVDQTLPDLNGSWRDGSILVHVEGAPKRLLGPLKD